MSGKISSSHFRSFEKRCYTSASELKHLSESEQFGVYLCLLRKIEIDAAEKKAVAITAEYKLYLKKRTLNDVKRLLLMSLKAALREEAAT